MEIIKEHELEKYIDTTPEPIIKQIILKKLDYLRCLLSDNISLEKSLKNDILCILVDLLEKVN